VSQSSLCLNSNIISRYLKTGSESKVVTSRGKLLDTASSILNSLKMKLCSKSFLLLPLTGFQTSNLIFLRWTVQHIITAVFVDMWHISYGSHLLSAELGVCSNSVIFFVKQNKKQ